jgi:hypothetical protein
VCSRGTSERSARGDLDAEGLVVKQHSVEKSGGGHVEWKEERDASNAIARLDVNVGAVGGSMASHRKVLSGMTSQHMPSMYASLEPILSPLCFACHCYKGAVPLMLYQIFHYIPLVCRTS